MSLKSGRVSRYLHDVTFLCQDVSLRTPSALSAAQSIGVCVRVYECVRVRVSGHQGTAAGRSYVTYVVD